MIITDVSLALLWQRIWLPDPGEYHAPAAVVTWDGTLPRYSPTGMPLDPAAALLCPALARALTPPRRALPPTPEAPTIAALEADYPAATAPFSASAAPAATFIARLNQGCRQCPSWKEADFHGRGRCNSALCHCSKHYPWLAQATCPAHRWPL